MPKRTAYLGAALLGALALAACGGTSPTSDPEAEPPATTAEPAGFAYPTDPSAVVLDVTTGGGFGPVEVAVDTRPEFRLYGDGTVLVKPEEFELTFPALRAYRLTPEGIQAVLAAAEDAGLLAAAPDYGQPLVADLPTTTLTVDLEGGSYSHSAYALGFGDAAGLTPAQQEARDRLSGLTSFLAGLDEAHPELLASEPRPYEPEAVRVYAFERELEPEQVATAWPLEPGIEKWSAEQAFGGRCEVVSGADVETLRQSLGETLPWLWSSGGRTWSTGFALQLPGDPGCARPV
jgi:hypothetical protein